MKLTLKRRFYGEYYTIGSLFVDCQYFCDTLEDKVRDLTKEKKVYGKTAIPAGTYPVILNRSPRFKRRLPRLLKVPFFDGILIHRGNTHEDTHGCILVGENKVKGKVINSTKYEVELVKRIDAAIKRGEKISIIVK